MISFANYAMSDERIESRKRTYSAMDNPPDQDTIDQLSRQVGHATWTNWMESQKEKKAIQNLQKHLKKEGVFDSLRST